MSRILVGTTLVCCSMLGGCCTPGVIGSQAVTLRGQETSMWCWAASGEMCMDFLGTDVSQCDQANRRFGLSTCCNNPVPDTCVRGGWPEFEKYDFSVTKTAWGVALTWAQIRNEIYCRERPFCFSWGWSGGGGHMMVIIGYITIGGDNFVVVNNPWPPTSGEQQVITYDEFVSGANHTHWVDYHTIRKN